MNQSDYVTNKCIKHYKANEKKRIDFRKHCHVLEEGTGAQKSFGGSFTIYDLCGFVTETRLYFSLYHISLYM